MSASDVGPDNKLSNQKLFNDFMIDGGKCGPDGVRCDVEGNLWCSSNAGRAVGYNGVTVWTRGKADRAYPSTGGHRKCLFRVSAELGRPKRVRRRRKRLPADFIVQPHRNCQRASLPYCRCDRAQVPQNPGPLT